MRLSRKNPECRSLPRLGLAVGLTLIMGTGLLTSCERGGPQLEAVQQEAKALQGEVTKLKEKIAQLEADVQKVQGQCAAPPPGPAAGMALPEQPGAPGEQALNVDQLLKQKEQFLGGKVTVEGRLGLVMIHRKSFFLKGSNAMVEVMFANIADKNTVQRLITQDWPGKVLVAGVFTPSAQEKTGFQITAENIELQ